MAGPICPGCNRWKPKLLRLCRECEFMEAANLPLPKRRAPSPRVQQAVDDAHAEEEVIQSLSDPEYLAYLNGPQTAHYATNHDGCFWCELAADSAAEEGFRG